MERSWYTKFVHQTGKYCSRRSVSKCVSFMFIKCCCSTIVMSRDRNAGRGFNVKIDNSSIERVEEFKYLGTTLTDQNSIQEEIKSRFKLGNACYYSVQNILSSRLLSKNLKIKIYRTIILPVVYMGVKPGR